MATLQLGEVPPHQLPPNPGPHPAGEPQLKGTLLQGYALHGHVDLHMWHTHVGSTGTSVQYILPVPWSRDCLLLGISSLDKIQGKTLQMVSGVS